MPFVQRDPAGRIISLSEKCTESCEEEISVDHPELAAFVQAMGADKLASTDVGFIRVLEDLIELLIARNVIRFTDLPSKAQEKMLQRRQLRVALHTQLDLIPEDPDDPLL
jgi:hypothetical protein